MLDRRSFVLGAATGAGAMTAMSSKIAQVIIADDFAVGLRPPETSLHMNRVANHYCRQQQIQRGLGQDRICR